jgi:IrrE N-terminal-like domain
MTESSRRQFVQRDREAEIAELAEAIADEYFPTERIEPSRIAQNKGITVSFGPYEDAFDGLLEYKGGRFHIYCNLDRVETSDSPRARFTLAHELGHFYIDEHRNALREGQAPPHPSLCEYESKNPAEQEADLFASNLLFPRLRFTALAKTLGAGIPGIVQLARQFGASITSTAIRYASLGIRPCSVIKWSTSGYAWKWLSAGTREAGFRKTIERISDIPPGSATARALAAESLPAAGHFQNGTTAGFWFPFIAKGSFRDEILIEQAMPLGRYGVLTVLYPQSGSFPWLR